MPKITKRLVDALEPDPIIEVFAWDTELKGFGVRVMPSGVASYVLKYRNTEGRQRKLALGRVGQLTPDEARRLARDKLGEVARGADPSAERRGMREAVTVAELCDLYLDAARKRVKSSTFANNRSHLEHHVKPLIGRRAVVGLTSDDVAKLHDDIVAGRTARAREGRGGVTTGGHGVASRTIVVFGSVLEFARQKRVIRENPARGVERSPDVKRRRYLSAAEIGRLGEAMRAAEAEGETATGIAAVRFLLLSGCRKNEALALPWAWVDAAGGCLRLEDTKTGAQLRPIGKAAFVALPEPRQGSPWVFPADRGGGHFIGVTKVLARLCGRAGVEVIPVHALRHTFAATAAGMGFSELTIAGLLGHTVQGVTARYAHVPDSALMAAADRLAEEVARQLLLEA